MVKAPTILGIALVAVGVLWVLQGVGYVGGSFMTGQQQWTYIGAVTGVIGIAVLLWANVRRI